ncbi:hypothetical protein [Ammoniphilus resinae]|uniref:Tfp pilus assembly protein PilN n=1 Tax=Ammoniphilus resinae TaxID=861532 RepID=A0ABS4GPH8_9BACL|nr:hypothetical protein [Ammoniphilus resinae]MBP1932180.1 Tfp pilus assembly protein PilN [Ammoniphilus resinae]
MLHPRSSNRIEKWIMVLNKLRVLSEEEFKELQTRRDQDRKGG